MSEQRKEPKHVAVICYGERPVKIFHNPKWLGSLMVAGGRVYDMSEVKHVKVTCLLHSVSFEESRAIGLDPVHIRLTDDPDIPMTVRAMERLLKVVFHKEADFGGNEPLRTLGGKELARTLSEVTDDE